MVQNNLLYIALSNLDAATYSVCYQTKIITTAIFSKYILGKHLSQTQWQALLLLFVGVALAETGSQLAHGSGGRGAAATGGAAAAGEDAGAAATAAAAAAMAEELVAMAAAGGAAVAGGGSGIDDTSVEMVAARARGAQNHLWGFMCVLLAACTSGFAGVYFELLLKRSNASLWVRNIQMGLPSVALSLASVFVSDRLARGTFSRLFRSFWDQFPTLYWRQTSFSSCFWRQDGFPELFVLIRNEVSETNTVTFDPSLSVMPLVPPSAPFRRAVARDGFFQGYSGIVASVVVLQAVGGLVVAVVVKYADNILKGFAAAFSILTSCALSAAFFAFEPSAGFIAGACLVIVSTFMYVSAPPPTAAGGKGGGAGGGVSGRSGSSSNVLLPTFVAPKLSKAGKPGL
ncbi:unnamed protein product [Phaeothamnion confervicola]